MFRKMALTVCLTGSCVWCFALVAGADPDVRRDRTAAGSVDFRPVAAIESLMHGQNTFFTEIRMALRNRSMDDRTELIEEAAEVLAELANVNRLNKDKEDYRTWATQLRDTALQLAHEADKEKEADEDKMNKLFQRLKDTCAACHDVYQ